MRTRLIDAAHSGETIVVAKAESLEHGWCRLSHPWRCCWSRCPMTHRDPLERLWRRCKQAIQIETFVQRIGAVGMA